MGLRISIVVTGLVMWMVWAGAVAGSAATAVKVTDPYLRAVPPGQPNSALFMVLHNSSADAHALVSASSAAAEAVELHTHSMHDGMMQMRRVASIDLPAGGEVRLEPGGLHVMLIGLKGDLQPGGTVALRLQFEDGSMLDLTAPVRKLQMKMKPDHSTMQHHHSGMKH